MRRSLFRSAMLIACIAAPAPALGSFEDAGLALDVVETALDAYEADLRNRPAGSMQDGSQGYIDTKIAVAREDRDALRTDIAAAGDAESAHLAELAAMIIPLDGAETPPISVPTAPDRPPATPQTGLVESAEARCDRLAAHPRDPQRIAAGVADGAIIPITARKACAEAAEAENAPPRIHFQLGRALLAADEKANARNAFILAARQEHAGATAMVGRFYENGWTLEADLAQAAKLYQRAAEGGFGPAADWRDRIVFVADTYHDPALGLILSGEATGGDATVSAYNAAAYQAIDAACSLRLPRDRVAWLYYWLEQGKDTAAQTRGARDGRALIARHGCNSPITTQMTTKMAIFLTVQ